MKRKFEVVATVGKWKDPDTGKAVKRKLPPGRRMPPGMPPASDIIPETDEDHDIPF